MKGQPFIKRLKFALTGIRIATQEPNFRIQLLLGSLAILLFLFFEASPLWWAILSFTIAGVLTAELFNTALEHLSDHLHPEQHPAIAMAKDCAAGAVLVLSLASLGVLTSFLFTLF